MGLDRCEPDYTPGIYETEVESFKPDDVYSADLVQFLCAFCNNTSWVYVADGRVAGYIITCIEGRSAHVISIAVRRDHRRRGVGSTLLCTALKELIAGRVERVYLEVRASNAPAIRLYEKAGFEVVERLSAYYSDGEDGFRMAVYDKRRAEDFCRNYTI